MRDFRVIVIALAVAAECVATGTRIHAADGARHPNVAWTLESLTLAERRTLYSAAQMTPEQVSTCVDSGFASCGRLTGQLETIRRIVAKLAARPGWQAATLPELLDARLAGSPPLPAERVDINRRLLDEVKSGTRCATVRREILRMATPNPTQLSLDSIDAVCGDAIRLDRTEPMWSDVEHLTVVARQDDRVHIVSGGDVAEYYELDGRKDAMDVGSSRVFVILLRRNARVTVRLMGPSRPAPRVWSYTVRGTGLITRIEAPPACLEVDLRPQNDPSLEAYVDGTLVGDRWVLYLHPWEHSLFSEPGDHNVTVLRKTPDGARVLTSLDLSDDHLRSAKGCYRLAFDFTEQDAMRDVAVLPPLVSPACAAVQVDAAGLHLDTERILRRLGREPKRAQAWADTMTNFATLVHQLSARDPVGASRGRMASDTSLETGAAEFVRQGFHTLVTVELICRNPSGSDGQLALRAHRIDLTAMTGLRDPGVGLDLANALRTETESVASSATLDLALVGMLGRLFRDHYVRFEHTVASRRFHGAVLERFDAYAPAAATETHEGPTDEAPKEYHAVLEARLLNREDKYLCMGPGGRVQLRSHDAAQQWWSTRTVPSTARTDHPIKLSAGMEVVETAEWNPADTGIFLLRLELQDRAYKRPQGASVAFRCVEVLEPPARFWGDLSYGRGPVWAPESEARAETLGYGALLVGFAHRTDQGSCVDVGFTLGYGHAIHSRQTPPSWELPTDGAGPAPSYDSQGHLRMNWTRQSLLAGGTLGYRIPAALCSFGVLECTEVLRAVDLRFRFTTVFDIGKVTKDGVDPGLAKFLTRADGLDLDLTSMLQGGVLVHLSRDRAVFASISATLTGWDDFWLGGRDQTAGQSAMTYDTALVLGGSVGAELDLW